MNEVQLPRDAFAVVDIELEQVRKSGAWATIRRHQSEWFGVASTCLSDTASSAAFALREVERDPVFLVGVVRGVDRAATRRCLEGLSSSGGAAGPAAALALQPAECREYENVAGALARCDVFPASMEERFVSALQALARLEVDVGNGTGAKPQVVKASRAALAQACSTATTALRSVDARRVEMGWDCEGQQAAVSPRLGEIDRDTFLIDERELVYLGEPGQAVLVLGQESIKGRQDELTRALKIALARSNGATAWFEAQRASDRPKAAIHVEFSSTYTRRGKEGVEHRLTASIEEQDGVVVGSVRARGARPGAFYQPAKLADLLLPDSSVALLRGGCEGPSASAGDHARCDAAGARFADLLAPPKGELTRALFRQAASTACQATRWSDALRSCVLAATTDAGVPGCAEAHATPDFFDQLKSTPLCGDREFVAEVRLPLSLIEAFVSLQVSTFSPRPDCRPAIQGEPNELSIRRDPQTQDPSSVSVSFEKEEKYWMIQVGAQHRGRADSRWRKTLQMDYDRMETNCLGTLEASAPDYRWSNSSGPCVMLSKPLTVFLGTRTRGEFNVQVDAGEMTVCQVPRTTNDCPKVPVPADTAQVALNEDGSLAVVVRGHPGAQRVETWHVATQRRLATFRPTVDAAHPCARAALLGKTVLLSAEGCALPRHQSALATLATLQGKRIAAVGGSAPVALTARAAHPLGGDLWGFVSATGDTMIVQNVSTGAVVRRIAIGEPATPGMFLAAADGKGAFVFSFGDGARAGSVLLGDATTGRQQTFVLSTCPAPR